MGLELRVVVVIRGECRVLIPVVGGRVGFRRGRLVCGGGATSLSGWFTGVVGVAGEFDTLLGARVVDRPFLDNGGGLFCILDDNPGYKASKAFLENLESFVPIN